MARRMPLDDGRLRRTLNYLLEFSDKDNQKLIFQNIFLGNFSPIFSSFLNVIAVDIHGSILSTCCTRTLRLPIEANYYRGRE